MKKFLAVIFIAVPIGMVGFGFAQGVQSDVFLVKDIKVTLSEKGLPPIDGTVLPADLIQIASVRVGQVSLFSLDLKEIENRIMTYEWIEKVRMEKKFPHTLSIVVTYRHPEALIQKAKGELAYVDSNGKIFGSSHTGHFGSISDLPLLAGFELGNSDKIIKAITLVKQWEGSKLGQLALLSTLRWDSERGYRLLISYPRKKTEEISTAELDSRIRAFIDIGHEVDAGLEIKLFHLFNVISYLSKNSIAVRQIWADVGKKIVVKTARSS